MSKVEHMVINGIKYF